MPRISTSAECGDVVPSGSGESSSVDASICSRRRISTWLPVGAATQAAVRVRAGPVSAAVSRSSASQAWTVADRPVSNNRNQFARIKIVVGKMPPSGF
jgi:hypothetical protein